MRVLFSAHSGSGHFHPLVPTARALEKAGHTVAFAVPEAAVATVRANGFTGFPAGLGFEQIMPGASSARETELRREAMLKLDLAAREALMARVLLDGFVDRFTRARLPALVELAGHWKPDLIVHESFEFAGALVGEKLGIPHASIQVGGASLDFADLTLVAERLDAVRADFGLKPDPELREPYRHLHLAFMPASFFSGGMPPTTRHLRLEIFDQSGTEGLPEWVSRLSGRPVVYATFGTVNKLPQHLRAIIEGLRDEPVELILTVGRDVDPAALGPQPAHVHVERYIPQSLLLPRCDVALMHGGYNSVMSALDAALPTLFVPFMADQPLNARSCERLGIGRMLLPEALTPDIIRQQVRELLADGGYRERARRLRDEARALPGLDRAVALLEQLGRDRALPAEAA